VIRAVIDTNVWVAGLLSSSGPPSRVVDMVIRGIAAPVVSEAILDELDEVLHRPELALAPADISSILGYLRLPGGHVIHVEPPAVERICGDPDDDRFLAAALAGDAQYVITGNLRHFPRSPWRDIQIVSPVAFLKDFGQEHM